MHFTPFCLQNSTCHQEVNNSSNLTAHRLSFQSKVKIGNSQNSTNSDQTMKAVLLRTSSNNVHAPVCSGSPKVSPGSPKVSLSRNNSLTGMFSWEKATSPNKSLHLEISPTRRMRSTITRSMSESDMVRCFNDGSGGNGMNKMMLPQSASRSSLSAKIEEDQADRGDQPEEGIAGWNVKNEVLGVGIGNPVEEEELELLMAGEGKEFDGGNGKGGNRGGSRGGDSGGGDNYKRRMAEYYEQIIKSNPHDSLLLRNYGKFLHEVEGNVERAEEYYGRALLESPGDGEVLSLYANLIWNNYKDQHRAFTYFHNAASASPNDCMVLGSYAHFMWVTEEDDEGEGEAAGEGIKAEEDVPPPQPPSATATRTSPAMVSAF
ncbi:hypothetical protein LINPERPRIM_LOCUS6945 [Linum perenne]